MNFYGDALTIRARLPVLTVNGVADRRRPSSDIAATNGVIQGLTELLARPPPAADDAVVVPEKPVETDAPVKTEAPVATEPKPAG